MAKDEDQQSAAQRARAFGASHFLAIMIVVVMAAVVVQNTDDTTVHLFGESTRQPLWAVLVAVFVAGALTGALLAYRRRHSK